SRRLQISTTSIRPLWRANWQSLRFSISLTSQPILPGWGPSPFATGVTTYLDRPGSLETSPRIYLEVRPAQLESSVLAMVDTAAPWCIFTSRIGEILQTSFDPVEGVALNTRLGTFTGHLYQVPLTFPAREGESLDVDAMVFVSLDWPGGNFLGY